MNIKEEINLLITNPNYSIESTDLRAVLEDYPYFEIGHYMVARQMKHKDQLASAEALKMAAMHASDRKRLYKWLNSSAEVDELLTVDDVKDEATENLQEIAEHNVADTLSDSEITIPVVTEENGSLEKIETLDEIESKTEEADVLDRLIINSSTEHLLESELKSRADLEPLKDVVEEKAETKEKEDVSEKEDASFIDWLHKMKPLDNEQVGEYLNEDSPETESEQVEEETSEESAETDLEEISIQAEVSVTDKGNFITETLADIYIKQKKYPKAIQALEELSLKYPEKSGYFASRIEEIKKLS